ncbi:hypothetical protein [Actinophytocola sp. KF-1]
MSETWSRRRFLRGALPAGTEVTRTGESGFVVRAAWQSPGDFPVGLFLRLLTVDKFVVFGS